MEKSCQGKLFSIFNCMFLLVPAHPGCPGQNPRSHETVVCVRACVHACVRACVRACMRACVRAWLRACMRVCVRACYCLGLNQCLLDTTTTEFCFFVESS